MTIILDPLDTGSTEGIIPASTSRGVSVTYHDVLDRLLDFAGGSSEGRNLKLAKRAILDAVRDIANRRQWTYYYRRERITTTADYTTGTVAFDLTGGTYERQITLSSGTWPDDAADGIVKIDNVEYLVERRISGTVLTLKDGFAPADDVTAGTDYVWYRDTYPLPADFRRADQIIDLEFWSFRLMRVTVGEILRARQLRRSPARPDLYAITVDPRRANRLAIVFEPPPLDVYNFDYVIQRTPYPMRTMDYSTGTATVNTGTDDTLVSGTGTSWTADMEGAVVRVSADTDVPSGVDGLHPFSEERFIDAVDVGAQEITVTEAFSLDHASKKYRISERIDIEEGAMYSAFVKCAEYNLSMMLNREDVALKKGLYESALRLAMEADNRGYERKQQGYVVPRVRDLPIGSDIGG